MRSKIIKIIMAAGILFSSTVPVHAFIPALPKPANPNDIENVTDRANAGNVNDQYQLGLFYEAPYGGSSVVSRQQNIDYYSAMKWFKLAAEQGNADAKAHYDKLKNEYDQFMALRTAALTGDPKAEYEYVQDRSTLWLFDPTTQPMNWYLRSAQSGYADAQFEAGLAFFRAYNNHLDGNLAPAFEADPIIDDLTPAIDWLGKAGAQGYGPAASFLALVYAAHTPANDPQKAKHWLEIAALKDEESEGTLCELEYSGQLLTYFDDLISPHTLADIRIQPDYAKAFACYSHYITRSDTAAQDARWHLAEMYYHGRGVKRDDARAEALFIAFLNGDDDSREYTGFAKADLARIYSNSPTVKRDYIKAYHLFDEALDSFNEDQGRCSNSTIDMVEQARLKRIDESETAAYIDQLSLVNKMSNTQRKLIGIDPEHPPQQPPRVPRIIPCD